MRNHVIVHAGDHNKGIFEKNSKLYMEMPEYLMDELESYCPPQLVGWWRLPMAEKGIRHFVFPRDMLLFALKDMNRIKNERSEVAHMEEYDRVFRGGFL